jgi:PIN domain nuclease of toxin-antitoxin system
MRILLDTSTFLWFITGDPKLPASVSAIRSPTHEVWLSAVSFWEILIKHALGRLPLPEPPSLYVPRRRRWPR